MSNSSRTDHLGYRTSQPQRSREHNHSYIAEQDPWSSLPGLGILASVGMVVLIHGYGPYLPRLGTSSSVVDHRMIVHRVPTTPSRSFRQVISGSVGDQLQELQAAFSLNKSQLARVLGVSRPTLYDWFQGQEPNPSNAERLGALLRVLARAGVSGLAPLDARFVRRPLELDEPSLLDLLGADALDEERLVTSLVKARKLGEDATARRREREARLLAQGFEELSDDRRRQQLADNIALLKWPKP